jgi:hypothetical protein
VVPHASQPTVVRDDATTVAVNQSPQEVRAIAADDVCLPADKFDWSLMLPTRPVLREQTWPMTGVHRDDVTPA